MTRVITSNNIDLETLVIEGNKLKVNVANIVPAAKADKFLKSVTANDDNTALVFTVGTDAEDDAPLEVPVANFLEGLVKTAELEAANTKVQELEAKVQELEAAKVTAENLSALFADPTVKAALLASIKGEVVEDLEGVVKGYLIAE